MDEILAGIKRMGFDDTMAENIFAIVRLSVEGGREAAIEECAKVAEEAYADPAYHMLYRMAATSIAARIRDLVGAPTPTNSEGKL